MAPLRAVTATASVASLFLMLGGCPLWERAPARHPELNNMTDEDVWLAVEIDDGRLSLLGRADANTMDTVGEACGHPRVLVFLERPDSLVSENDVLYAYDAVANPEFCDEEFPDAVWVWDGQELVFTDGG